MGKAALGTQRRHAVLMANFDNADIFGDFRAVGTHFSPTAHQTTKDPKHRPRHRKCIDLRGAHIRGDVETRLH